MAGDQQKSGCPSENELAAFLEGRLSPEEAARCDEHIDACQACLVLYMALGGTAEEQPAVDPGQVPTALAHTGVQDAAPGPFDVPTTFDEFRLLRPLGRGAMGQVYLGHDTLLDRSVAIKFLAASQPDQATRERFLTEARAIARLQHPNVVAAYRFGEVQGRPYLVSEFIRGQSLDKLPKPVPWEQVLRIGLGLARGLELAHRRGVLHRDIKPANAIAAPDGQVKLLDFGLAKMLERQPGVGESMLSQEVAVAASPELTGAGALVGTPLYLAPELWQGEPASRRSDVYSLGALLYDLCSGRPPHREKTLGALRQAVQDQDVAALSQVAPGVQGRLAAVVDRMLARDPDQRPTMAEVATVLGDVSPAGADVTARDVPRAAWPRRLRRGGALLGVAAVLLGSIAVVSRWSQPGHRMGASGPTGSASDRVLIAGGTFRMGSTASEIEAAYLWCQAQYKNHQAECPLGIYQREQPLHQVRLSPFWIDATEVTNERFAAWLSRQPGLQVSPGPDGGTDDFRRVRDGQVPLVDLYPSYGPTFGLTYAAGRIEALEGFEHKPVTQVTWDGALRYCQAHGGRLPTEAEWEFAARGSTGRRFPWGNREPTCTDSVFGRAEELNLACAALGRGPAEVGQTPVDRTPDGVYDLAGNVQEWVMDRFEERYRPCGSVCVDPLLQDVPAAGGTSEATVARVVRGGSWYQAAAVSRSAGRSRWRQDQAVTNIGFRCAWPVTR